MTLASDNELEGQIAEWRAYMRRRRELHQADTEELEDHLRTRITELTDAGLRADEAFLIAVKRMGSLDELSREFAREHSERLWKQLVLPGEPNAAAARSSTSNARGSVRRAVRNSSASARSFAAISSVKLSTANTFAGLPGARRLDGLRGVSLIQCASTRT